MGISHGPTGPSHHRPGASTQSPSWEGRRVCKHRRTVDDEGCSAKRRRLMGEPGSEPWDNPGPNGDPTWPPGGGSPSSRVLEQALEPNPALAQSSPRAPDLEVAFSGPSPAAPRTDAEGSCMEVEVVQRKLQEIEERITLEDDDEEEDLDVEPAQRRPVLVMSDSLREGLQRGISDILPHKVAQSMSRSCMELVVWRSPEEALARRLKDSLQRQRKQQSSSRQTPTPSPSPVPQPCPPVLLPKEPQGDGFSPLYCNPGASSSGEEDMEL